MIKSRHVTTDFHESCAYCDHLNVEKYISPFTFYDPTGTITRREDPDEFIIQCNVDGAKYGNVYPLNGITCDKYMKRKENKFDVKSINENKGKDQME